MKDLEIKIKETTSNYVKEIFLEIYIFLSK